MKKHHESECVVFNMLMENSDGLLACLGKHSIASASGRFHVLSQMRGGSACPSAETLLQWADLWTAVGSAVNGWLDQMPRLGYVMGNYNSDHSLLCSVEHGCGMIFATNRHSAVVRNAWLASAAIWLGIVYRVCPRALHADGLHNITRVLPFAMCAVYGWAPCGDGVCKGRLGSGHALHFLMSVRRFRGGGDTCGYLLTEAAATASEDAAEETGNCYACQLAWLLTPDMTAMAGHDGSVPSWKAFLESYLQHVPVRDWKPVLKNPDSFLGSVTKRGTCFEATFSSLECAVKEMRASTSH
jgi:hypothetical protein